APVHARRIRGACRSRVDGRCGEGAGARAAGGAAARGGARGYAAGAREAGGRTAERGIVGADLARDGQRAAGPVSGGARAFGGVGAAGAGAAGPRALFPGDDRRAVGAEHAGGALLAPGARGAPRDRGGGFGDDAAAGGGGRARGQRGAPRRIAAGGRARALHAHPLRHLRAGQAHLLVLRIAHREADGNLSFHRRAAAQAESRREAGQPQGRRHPLRPRGKVGGAGEGADRGDLGVGERAVRARDERGGARPVPLPHHARQHLRPVAARRLRGGVGARESVVALPAAHPRPRPRRQAGRQDSAGAQQRRGTRVDGADRAALRHPRDEIAGDHRLRDVGGVRAAHQLGRA
ncbi:MAG: hypothetical protein AVDCRST_MAG89-3652, partial [uncultured Gemmatimonadetes bacterium]